MVVIVTHKKSWRWRLAQFGVMDLLYRAGGLAEPVETHGRTTYRGSEQITLLRAKCKTHARPPHSVEAPQLLCKRGERFQQSTEARNKLHF
eukprot:scaffold7389_cov73-Skeletonema_dohrnii-CCMP3373.AAC.3